MELINSPVQNLIRFCKWVELLFLKLFPSFVKRRIDMIMDKAGIVINGKNLWDLKVLNGKEKELFYRIVNQGSLGFAEGYMDGLYDCDDLPGFTTRLLRSRAYLAYFNPWNTFLNWLGLVFFNNQTKSKAFEVGKQHYDLGNDLYQAMLDPAMNYSCGYWKTARNLEEAQYNKMELIAKKLMLKPGMKVLDIGSGWGGLCKHLAENYGVSCLGVTISEEQVKYCKENCKGLPTDFKLIDYRELPKSQKFDRIVSVGMFEHVGQNNYEEYFRTAHNLLEDDGIFLLHTIGVAHHDVPLSEPFLGTYIFPNGVLPYYKHIADRIEKKFIIEDWQNMSWDYSKTLESWDVNFEKRWPLLKNKYGDRFYRMWKYYLQFCIGCFKARKLQLWQVVLSKDGIQGGYYAAR